MNCTIDGAPQVPEVMACQERHFGQSASGIDLLPYEVRMTRAELVALSHPLYTEFAGYEKDDEPFYRPGVNPVIDRWHQLRYPALDELIDLDSPLVEYLVLRRIGQGLLLNLFPLTEGRTRFVLNSLDAVEVTPSGVLLAGKAWQV